MKEKTMIWLDVLQGFSTPVIGVAVIYIAWQQHKTNKKQVKFNLYKRRIIIVNAYDRFILTTALSRAVSLDTLSEFKVSTAEAKFLFDKNITDYLEEVRTKASRLFAITFELNLAFNPLPGPERDKVVQEKVELVDWFIHESQTGTTKFDKFLQVE